MTANSLIEDTLERIGGRYHPGALAWVKRARPRQWEEMLTLEEEINRRASIGDEEGLKKALGEYQGMILDMVRMFKSPGEGQGVLFDGR